MKPLGSVTKSYLNKKYEYSDFPILYLSCSCKKVFYANFSAMTSFGKLAQDGHLEKMFADGWKNLFKLAKKNDGIAFIPLKDNGVFSHCKLFLVKHNGKVKCYEVHLVPRDISIMSDNSLPATLLLLHKDQMKMFDVVSNIGDNYPEASPILDEINKSILKMHHFKTDILECMWKNLLDMRNPKKIFDVASLMTLVENDTYPIDTSEENITVGKNLYIKGSIAFYKTVLEETALVLSESTPDTSRVQVSTSASQDRIIINLFKNGMSYRLGAAGSDEEVAVHPPLFFFIERMLSAVDTKIDFAATPDGFSAKISIPRHIPNEQ